MDNMNNFIKPIIAIAIPVFFIFCGDKTIAPDYTVENLDFDTVLVCDTICDTTTINIQSSQIGFLCIANDSNVKIYNDTINQISLFVRVNINVSNSFGYELVEKISSQISFIREDDSVFKLQLKDLERNSTLPSGKIILDSLIIKKTNENSVKVNINEY